MPISADRLRRLFALMGWLALAGIILSTLSPIEQRPHVPGLGPTAERFLAFWLLAFSVALAHPRRRWTLLAAGLAFVLAIEAAQYLTATRHARLSDAVVKGAGLSSGLALAIALEWIARRLARHEGTP